MAERSAYFLESYIPKWLAANEPYQRELVKRLVSMVEGQGYTVVGDVELEEPVGDFPPPPSMTTIRAVVQVEEFDVDIPARDES